jgi:hypothetical protein
MSAFQCLSGCESRLIRPAKLGIDGQQARTIPTVQQRATCQMSESNATEPSMPQTYRLPTRLALALVALALATPALAQDAPAKRRHKASASTPRAMSQDARHQDCLAFIQRHGLSCDPWKEPTCGYDLGVFRPMTCVAP